MPAYIEHMQKLVNEYRKSGMPWPASAKGIAAWAIEHGHWQPHRSKIIEQCADDLSRAMREEYITDPQGRRVRAKHAARILQHGEQKMLWDDIRHASRNHMHRAFQLRRNQIVGDCRQLKTDADSFNENANDGEPIQMVFDFTRDLEEMEALASA